MVDSPLRSPLSERGQYRGRGAGRGWRGSRGYKPAPTEPVKKPTFHIKRDLGPLIEQFQTLPRTTTAARVTMLKSISSYSWVEGGDEPTIIVPSSPPVWTKTSPRRVPADTGKRYSDQNSARMGPKLSPLIPIFASIDHMDADIDLPSFDIVTDRNNLLKLLHWASNSEEYDDFRIDVELAGKTCLFTRTDEVDIDVIEGFRGYGEEYHKAVAKWPKGSEGATGHHRVISIDLDGIKILLRFEIDARIEVQEDKSNPNDDVDDLVDALSSLLTSSSKAPARKTTSFAGLTVKPSENRMMVPQSSIIKLKTRAEHKPLNMEDVGPQIHLSQTPYLYLAKHVRGDFQPAQRIIPDVQKIELQLGKLREALLDIVEVVREQAQGEGLALTCVERKLELYKRGTGTGRSVGWDIISKFVPGLSTTKEGGAWGDDEED
ncbi:hypothetical protein FRC04_011270 [Tulasnella sp. 424]|nr:hypothetical protein FRC04_011270 [Tulasnella sp. 424]KAG8971808.1 hypothetical protein FRC05_010768 [Tulasnella sp. 425]